jgi:predicted transcriptional regulator
MAILEKVKVTHTKGAVLSVYFFLAPQGLYNDTVKAILKIEKAVAADKDEPNVSVAELRRVGIVDRLSITVKKGTKKYTIGM